MNSPKNSSSPTYRNLNLKHKQSPVELKEKLRKSYKDKIQNCRNILLNRLRGTVYENDLRETLTDIYKNMFNFTNNNQLDEEENEILEEIKNELVQEEFDWWVQEYEKSQLENVDWSALEEDENVICPLCQKSNLSLTNNNLSCSLCKMAIKTDKSLQEIKHLLVSSTEKHSNSCNNVPQFHLVPELNECHVYLMCDSCMEMQIVV